MKPNTSCCALDLLASQHRHKNKVVLLLFALDNWDFSSQNWLYISASNRQRARLRGSVPWAIVGVFSLRPGMRFEGLGAWVLWYTTCISEDVFKYCLS